MHREIEYGNDIIVGVIYSGVFRWYVSEKEIWVLDQVKWGELFSGGNHPAPDGFADRFGIGIVNEFTCDQFLAYIHSDSVSTQDLTEMLMEVDSLDTDARLPLIPSLFVNFDAKVLISNFPEPLEFERFVPEGWTSSYQNFDEEIPVQHRYWQHGKAPNKDLSSSESG